MSVICSYAGFSDVPGFCGPFEDDGNLYAVLVHKQFTITMLGLVYSPTLTIWRSTDRGSTWPVGTLSLFLPSIVGYGTVRVVAGAAGSHLLWISYITERPEVGLVLVVRSFDMQTFAWGTASEPPLEPVPVSFDGGAVFPNFQLTRRSDDTLVAYISYENPSGTENISLNLYDPGAGGWQVGFTPDNPAGGTVNALQSAIEGVGDRVHAWTWNSGEALDNPTIYAYSVEPYFLTGGALVTISFGGRYLNQPMVGHATTYDVGADHRLCIPYWALDDLHVIEAGDTVPLSPVSDQSLGTMSAGFGAPLISACYFAGARYIFTIQQNPDITTNIVYFRNAGDGWTGPYLILANTTAYNISAVPVLGSIGIIYDDASTGGALDRTNFLLLSDLAQRGCRYRGWIA